MLFDLHAPRALADDEFAALQSHDARVLTLIAAPDTRALDAQDALAAAFDEWQLLLLARRRLSRGDARRHDAVEFFLGGLNDGVAPAGGLRALADRLQVDLCLQLINDKRPRRRLLVFDMDSTLIRCEVIDELAARAGVGEEVAAITARAMRGELDFRQSFRERMARLSGLSEHALASVAGNLPIMPGAERLFRVLNDLGHHTAILSGGFDYFAHRVARQLGISEIHANHLQIREGQLTGEVDGPIVDGERKAALLQEIARREGFSAADTVAVGDGANDLPMLSAAGLGVAFHAKPLVRERAPCAVSHGDLDSLLYLLGVPDPP